jgi:replicative DNA helicase
VKVEQANIQAEMSVLGSMILSPKATGKALSMLTETDFFRSGHLLIFGAIRSLTEDGKAVDLVSIRTELGKNLPEVGNMDYLMQLAEYVPSAANVETYARLVKDASNRRKLIELARQIDDLSNDSAQDVSSILSEGTKALRDIAKGSEKSPLKSLKRLMMDWNEFLTDDAEKVLYTSGFSVLDEKIGGFGPGDQVILAAYSGMGKTAFAFDSVLLNSSRENANPWVIFSKEMAGAQLVSRFVQSRTGISVERQRRRQISPAEFSAIESAMEEFYKLPIYVSDSGDVTPQIIQTRIDEVVDKHGRIGGVMIDYLGMVVKSTKSSRAEAVEQFCFATKDLAKENNCTMLILSQLSRESQKSDSKSPTAPQLHHLKESGGIEASADLVLAIHRPEYYEAKKRGDGEKKAAAEIHILKSRYGATGKVELVFTPWQARFTESW